MLAPDQVVKSARPKASPIHKYFEWDDSAAAAEFRKNQARNLISAVEIVEGPSQHQGERIRAFVSVPARRRLDPRGSYTSMQEALADETSRRSLLINALLELRAHRERFEALKSVAGWTEGIDMAAAALGGEAGGPEDRI